MQNPLVGIVGIAFVSADPVKKKQGPPTLLSLGWRYEMRVLGAVRAIKWSRHGGGVKMAIQPSLQGPDCRLMDTGMGFQTRALH